MFALASGAPERKDPRVPLDDFLAAQLDTLKSRDQFRDPADANARAALLETERRGGPRFLDASSNDYLGLARTAVEPGAAPAGSVSRETLPHAGAGASRLVQGTRPEHEALERELAEWVRAPAALLFSSGFAANLGAVSALAGPESVIISDELNHASLIDGCRLSRAEVCVVPHCSLAHLDAALAQNRAAAARWVVLETYFSMDGDGPDLTAVRALCDRHRAFLVVDEAHALGVFGPEGAGRCAAFGVKPDVLVGALGKAVGSQGAFVAGSELVRTLLWNRARSFVFSTAPSPALCAATRQQVRAARDADGSRQGLHERCDRFRASLRQLGLPVLPRSFGPIVPLVAGRSGDAQELAHALRAEGVLAQPIRPPTVPEGLARIRLTLNAGFDDADVERLTSAVQAAWNNVFGSGGSGG